MLGNGRETGGTGFSIPVHRLPLVPRPQTDASSTDGNRGRTQIFPSVSTREPSTRSSGVEILIRLIKGEGQERARADPHVHAGCWSIPFQPISLRHQTFASCCRPVRPAAAHRPPPQRGHRSLVRVHVFRFRTSTQIHLHLSRPWAWTPTVSQIEEPRGTYNKTCLTAFPEARSPVCPSIHPSHNSG